ncbi:MAG: hypothetical protein EA379_09580, partial [Phycisphaerales bacterium]
MATIGSIVVNVSASTTALSQGLNRARMNLAGFGKAMLRGAVVVGAFGAALATAAGGALALVTRRAFASIDATAKLARSLGVATEAVIALHHAAQLNGVSTQVMNRGLQMMTRTLGEAASRGGPAADEMARLGLDAARLASMRPDEAFREIAQAISEIQNPVERARAAYLLFGRQGMDLINVLALGADGLDAATREAERLGATFSAVDAAKIESANDSVLRLKTLFQGVGNQIAIQVAPLLSAVVERLVEAATAGSTLGEKVAGGMRMAVRAVGFLLDVFEALAFGSYIVQRSILQMASFILRHFQRIVEGAAMLPDWMGGGVAGKAAEGMARLVATVDAGLDYLQQRIDGLVQSPPASERLLRTFDDIQRKAQEAAEAIAGQTGALEDFQGAMEAVADEQERMNDLQRKAQRIYDATRTPLERYENTIGELSELLEKGLIDWETYGRAVQQAREELEGRAAAESASAGPGQFGTIDLSEIDLAGLALFEDRE